MALPPGSVVAPFGVHVDLVGGRVTLTGRLDRSRAHLLLDALTALTRIPGDRWVLDVGSLDSCDGDGLRAIGAGYRYAVRHRRNLTLTGAAPALQRRLIWLRLAPHLLPDIEPCDAPVGDPEERAG
ncbi:MULTISPECIES: STAS domain-containing protein [unclassified Blastococcus]